MSEQTRPKAGDTVRVSFDGVWRATGCQVIAGESTYDFPPDATVEVLERADDPASNELGTLRLENHTDDPGHSVWLCTENNQGRRGWFCVYSTAVGNQGGRLEDDEVVGLPVVGSLFGTPAAEAEKLAEPSQVPGPRCNAMEGATGITCGLPRFHGPDVDHEGRHEYQGDKDPVGYWMFVRWPWNEYDRDAEAVGAEVPLPDWEREIIEQEAAAKEPVEEYPGVSGAGVPHPPADGPRYFQGLSGGRYWKILPDGAAFYRCSPANEWKPCGATIAGLSRSVSVKETTGQVPS